MVSLPSRRAGNAKLWVRAPIRAEKMTPSAKLDRLRMAVRPHEAAMTPLPGPRDALPDGRTAHALVLTYKFSLAEDGKVTPTLPMLNRCVLPSWRHGSKATKTAGTSNLYPSAPLPFLQAVNGSDPSSFHSTDAKQPLHQQTCVPIRWQKRA